MNKTSCIYLLCLAAATTLLLGGIHLLIGKMAELDQSTQPAQIIRDLAAHQPVSKTAFEVAFPPGGSVGYEASLRHASQELGVKFEDVRGMVEATQLSIIFTGNENKIPEKLRPTTAPATQPTTQPEKPVSVPPDDVIPGQVENSVPSAR